MASCVFDVVEISAFCFTVTKELSSSLSLVTIPHSSPSPLRSPAANAHAPVLFSCKYQSTTGYSLHSSTVLLLLHQGNQVIKDKSFPLHNKGPEFEPVWFRRKGQSQQQEGAGSWSLGCKCPQQESVSMIITSHSLQIWSVSWSYNVRTLLQRLWTEQRSHTDWFYVSGSGTYPAVSTTARPRTDATVCGRGTYTHSNFKGSVELLSFIVYTN